MGKDFLLSKKWGKAQPLFTKLWAVKVAISFQWLFSIFAVISLVKLTLALYEQ